MPLLLEQFLKLVGRHGLLLLELSTPMRGGASALASGTGRSPPAACAATRPSEKRVRFRMVFTIVPFAVNDGAQLPSRRT
jgi:hypothetical protein